MEKGDKLQAAKGRGGTAFAPPFEKAKELNIKILQERSFLELL